MENFTNNNTLVPAGPRLFNSQAEFSFDFKKWISYSYIDIEKRNSLENKIRGLVYRLHEF